jgi:glycosyltransferase involved in cell wall biosynthesis
VKKAGLENQVEFFGWQPQEKVFEFIMKSDITLIPHLKSEHTDNTSPNKIFHYMLAQKPVLASDCNYLKRILNAANCGLIYQNNSSEDFARQLKEKIDSPDKRKIWGENGLKAVKNEYNWELTSRQLPVLYQFGN